MTSLKFGTSGLRGLVVDLTNAACRRYTQAFIAHLRAERRLSGQGAVLVGRDLRASSPRIADACREAVVAAGCQAIDCGALPTPALALAALARQAPAVMVTGSHIPDDRNGLKFYRADGEIDKADEAGINAWLDRPRDPPALPGRRDRIDALAPYVARYADLGSGLLAGLQLGVYQHSSVARDVLVTILGALGAEIVPFARAEHFVPVDTEALRAEDVALARQLAETHRLDAIVSTDGDGDRPLIADETGSFLRGDIVGTLTARWLGADVAVTPVTSSSVVERAGCFATVIRTKVGSPYVVAAMHAARGRVVVGFEANGGVLLGSDTVRPDLRALPTRDAVLPIVAVLALMRAEGIRLSALVAGLPARFSASDRLEGVGAEQSSPLLKRLGGDAGFASQFFGAFGPLARLDTTDGIRATLANGDIIHYRASGNAPELRCYSETDRPETASALVQRGLARFARELSETR